MIYYLNRGDFHCSILETYPLRPVKDFSKKIRKCPKCGKDISKGAKYCMKCSHIINREILPPSREELKKLVRNNSFVALGKQFGVSDKTISNWCKAEKIPFKRKDIKLYSEEEWLKI